MSISELNTQLEYLAETKSQIKTAITNKGQDIISTTPFRDYVEKINNISTLQADTADATVTSDDILEGKTAYAGGQKITGTIKSFTDTGKGNVTVQNTADITTDSIAVSGGYTFDEAKYIKANDRLVMTIPNNSLATKLNLTADKIKAGETLLGIEGTLQEGIDTSDATAIAEDISLNKTAYVNGQKITGSLPLFPNTRTFTVDNAGVTDNTEDSQITFSTINTLKQILDSNLNMEFSANYTDIVTVIGLTSDKLLEGNIILGVEGIATTGTTADIVIAQDEYGLETATSGEGDNDIGYKFYTTANTQSKLYNIGSIVEMHITNELLAQILGITADKIKKDEVICGITGTYEATVEAQEQIATLTQENQTLNTTINDSNELAEDILGTTTN